MSSEPLDYTLERELYGNGYTAVCGVDEAGRGPLCGPVCAAACILPLPKHTHVDSELGTRHRAAVGLSEVSDAVVVIVSEETGVISVAVGGVLKRHLAPQTLERLLHNELCPENQEEQLSLKEKLQKILAELKTKAKGDSGNEK